MSSNNAPEKWATKFMNNVEMGNKIPLKSRNNTALENLNIRMPASWVPPSPSSFPQTFSMQPLRPMGTRSGLDLLPNLKTPLNLRPTSRLTAAASEWVPSPPPPPPLPPGPPPLPPGPPPLPPGPPPIQSYKAPQLATSTSTSFLSVPILLDFMRQGGRIFVKDYPVHVQDELRRIMQQYRYDNDIHYLFKNPKTGLQEENPYYYIGHRTQREPLRSKGQSRRKMRTKRKRTQTHRHRR